MITHGCAQVISMSCSMRMINLDSGGVHREEYVDDGWFSGGGQFLSLHGFGPNSKGLKTKARISIVTDEDES